jgi:hypothetical protein
VDNIDPLQEQKRYPLVGSLTQEFLGDGQMHQNNFGALAIRRSNESVLRLSEAKRLFFIA